MLAREAERAEGRIDLRFLKDYLRLFFGMGIRDVSVHSDCQVVRDVEAGDLMYCETSGTDRVQDVTIAVGGEVDLLCEVETL